MQQFVTVCNKIENIIYFKNFGKNTKVCKIVLQTFKGKKRNKVPDLTETKHGSF